MDPVSKPLLMMCLLFLRLTEEELCATVTRVFGLAKKGAAKIGLSLDNPKALLLFPNNMTPTLTDLLPPSIGLRSNTFESVKLRGLEIVGAPVGAPDFCSTFVNAALDKMLQHSASLLKLHPQSATKLLRDCVCAAPAYLAQVCHPNFTKGPLIKFDDSVWS